MNTFAAKAGTEARDGLRGACRNGGSAAGMYGKSQVVAIATALFMLCIVPGAHATPDKAAGFYEDALGRFERNDVAGAVIQLKNALQQDKRMLAAHLLLGKALLRNGDLKGAEAALEEALGQGVNRSEVALPLGQIYLALGRPELVIERIPASGLPPALQVEVLAIRGTAYVELSRPTLAGESFQEARRLDGKAVAPLIAEIPLLLTLGQQERAKALAAKAVELAPNNAYAWNMHASVLHAALDLGNALRAYDRALTLESKHVDARVARAGLLIDMKREHDAATDLDLLARLAPSDPRAAYLRAVLASHKGNAPAIAVALGDVVKLVDTLPSAWLARREQLLMVGALSHHALGNWEKAREYLNILIARNSRSVSAKKLLASIYVETRDYARALSHLEALHEAAPEDPQVLFLLGSVHLAQRRYMTATEMLEKAAARTGSPAMNRTLAFSQLGLGRSELGSLTLEKVFSANPGDVRAGMTLAMLYMRRGQAQKALQIAQAMVKRDVENLAALNFLGAVKASTGDKAGARTAYARILEKDPGFRPAAMNLARLDASEQRFDVARRRLSDLLAKQHDAHDVLFELGLLERRAGRPAEAIRHLQKASLVQRRDPRPGLALIDLYLDRRQIDEALAAAKELSSRHADSFAVQVAWGRVHLAAGDRKSARVVFENATRLAGVDPVMQIEIARLQLAAANPDAASNNVHRALQARPDDPAALALLVEIERRRGDMAKADAALKTLRARHPNRLETVLAAADLAMARGQHGAALTAYRIALSHDASTNNVLNIVRAHVAAGEAGKATVFLESWLQKRPNDLTALKALAETQFRAGQLTAARETYARVIASVPEDAATLNNYANLLHKLDDSAARAHAEKALTLAPGNPAFMDTLGWILVQRGHVDAGLRYLRDARLRSPENAEVRFHLAYALAKASRLAEARAELTAALSVPGRFEHSREVIQLKKELGV